MLTRVWVWIEAGVALLALTIVTLACHAMWPDKDGVAAWFQAIGSVAGIGIAVYVPWKQRHDAVRLEHALYVRTRTDAVEKLDFVAFDINLWLTSAKTMSNRIVWQGAVFQIDRAEGEELRARLFKFHELPFADLEPFIFQLRSAVEEAMLFLEPKGATTIPVDDESRMHPFRRLKESVYETRQDMDKYRDIGLAVLHKLDARNGTSLRRPYETSR